MALFSRLAITASTAGGIRNMPPKTEPRGPRTED
jgi:hypothetical protein